MCKRGRVSQEDDSDQPFKKFFMRESIQLKNLKLRDVNIQKIRSFQKEIIQMQTKIIQKYREETSKRIL